MLDHLSLPVADYARSRAFYDACLAALGYRLVMEMTDLPEFIAAGYGPPGDQPEPQFWIGAGREPGPAPVTPDGQHIAFAAGDHAAVDAFMQQHSRPVVGTTGRLGCARTITPTTTLPSSSTPTATAWRPCAIGRAEPAAPGDQRPAPGQPDQSRGAGRAAGVSGRLADRGGRRGRELRADRCGSRPARRPIRQGHLGPWQPRAVVDARARRRAAGCGPIRGAGGPDPGPGRGDAGRPFPGMGGAGRAGRRGAPVHAL